MFGLWDSQDGVSISLRICGKPKMKMVDGELTLGDEIRFQKMFMGLTGAEMTSINPQIMNLFFPSTVQHKNGFLTMEK